MPASSPHDTSEPRFLAGPSGAPYSRAAVWGDLIVTAGQVAPADALRADTERQARAVLAALVDAVESAGGSRTSVLRVEAFLAESADFDAWNRAFRECFSATPPARTTVVTRFVIPGLLVEAQALAARVAS